MTVAATVIIPTHDHGPTLHYSIASIQNQTVSDIEIFVIGDGAPTQTREIMDDLAQKDARIRYFEYAKGPRLGEIYRHKIITEHATGKIICYHSDDDLMFPHHVATLISSLEQADFAHTLPVWLNPEGQAELLFCDVSQQRYRDIICSEDNRIPLSTAAHTRDLYLRLPKGWHSAPENVPTDQYMWRQILAQAWCRAVSIAKPTSVHFPSLLRKEWSLEQRCMELDRWQKKLGDAGYYQEFLYELLQFSVQKTQMLELYLLDKTVSLTQVFFAK